ncbi:MAG: hypothetical protein GY757_59570 [bacterium]|nr:hypothetical protein [bacterium]
MKRLTMVLLCLILLASCRADKNGDTVLAYEPEKEEYAVYSAAVNRCYGFPGRKNLLLIAKETAPAYINHSWSRHNLFLSITKEGSFLPGNNDRKISVSTIGQDTLEDFELKNQNQSPLHYQFNLRYNYLLIGKKEMNYISNSLIGDFQARPPKIYYLELSRVGFNKERNIAVVLICELGGSSLLVLNKINGKWIFTDGIGIWN